VDCVVAAVGFVFDFFLFCSSVCDLLDIGRVVWSVCVSVSECLCVSLCVYVCACVCMDWRLSVCLFHFGVYVQVGCPCGMLYVCFSVVWLVVCVCGGCVLCLLHVLLWFLLGD